MGLRQVQEIENHISTSSCHHPQLKDLVCHGKIDGTTPLLLACQHGELEAVKRIVELWGVDVRDTAVYHMQIRRGWFLREYDQFRNLIRETENGAEWIKMDRGCPLFVAAYNGNVDVVRYLLKNGADFLAKTVCANNPRYDGLTPLHGAFFDLRSEDEAKATSIACLLLEAGADPSVLSSDHIPIWVESTCGVEAITALINHGLDLTQRHPIFASTILHHWTHLPSECDITEEQSMRIVKLLVEKGADLLARDCHGYSPIITAAVSGNWSVLDFFLERDEISRMDKINALELAGSVILVTSQHASQRSNKAFEYWRRALQLRLATEGCGPIQKTPLDLKTVKAVEWVTSTQLEEVIQHPSEHLIQSFLVQFRFFVSCQTWKAFSSFASYVEQRQHQFYQLNGFDRALDMFWAMLEFFNRFVFQAELEIPTSKLFTWIYHTTRELVKVLSTIRKDNPLLLTVEKMKTSLELISETDKFFMAECLGTTSKYHMILLIDLIKLLAGLPQMLIEPGGRAGAGSSKSPETVIKESLIDFVQRKRRDEKGRTLLHIACKTLSTSDSLVTVLRLLLDHGADPDTCDVDGNAPLHVLAQFDGEVVDTAANLLLSKGAHFDRVNKSGLTAADVWIKRHKGSNGWSDRPSWCRPSIPPLLMCQCARVIRVNKVPYKEPLILPVSLIPFIEFH